MDVDDMTKQEKVPASDLKLLFEWNGKNQNGLTGIHQLRLCLWQLKIRPTDMDLVEMLEDLLIKSGADVIMPDQHKEINTKGHTKGHHQQKFDHDKVRHQYLITGMQKMGKVNVEDFVELVETRYLGKYSMEDQLREAFNSFDSDGSGSISPDELREMLSNMPGLSLSDEDLDNFIAEADADGDGEIDFDEFMAFMSGES